MVWILPKLSNYQQVAPSVRTGGSRHTGLAAPPHRNIHQKYGKKILDDIIAESNEQPEQPENDE